MWNRGTRIFILGSAILGSALAALAVSGTAEAAKVLVFNSTRYVDSNQGPGYAEGSQESDNVQASLAALGHTVATIAGVNDPVGTCGEGVSQPGTLLASAAEYTSALAANDVFLIPEQESWCYLPGDLLGAADVVAAWKNWVSGGGALIIHSSEEAMQKVDDLFAVVFGFRAGATAGTGIPTTRRPAAADTAFADAPGSIPGHPSTGLLPLGTLPTGAISIYDNGSKASVVILPFGSGKIIFLGWDWTKSKPPFADGLDGGWQQVLAAAVEEAIRQEPPPPPPPPPSFADVPPGHWARAHIQALAAAGVTAGCGGNNFCPDNQVTRAEMAVFLLRARHGAGFAPPPAQGVFTDVPLAYWAAAWVEQLVEEGVAAGCAADRYCPDDAVTRAQMAVLLVRATSAPGFVPPAATGVFNDVPATYWAAAWIEELARDGVTAGCGGGLFCPEALVSRAQMAVFLVTAFDLGP